MDVPFCVAFAAIILVGRYLPLVLPLNLQRFLVDNAARPARVAKCAILVAIGGLALLVSSMQQDGAGTGSGGPAGVASPMGLKVLWFNSATLFLGTLLLAVVVAAALHHPPEAERVPPPPFVLQVAVDHLAVATEVVAINAFAHNLCVLFKIAFKV